MKVLSLSEVGAHQDKIRILMTAYITEHPKIQLKTMAKQIGVNVYIIWRFVFKGKGLQSRNLLKIYDFIRKKSDEYDAAMIPCKENNYKPKGHND